MLKQWIPIRRLQMKSHKFKIGFRVDADHIIGTGHLMEIVTIINSLRKKIAVTLIIITKKNLFAIKKLKEIQVKNIKCLPSNISEETETKEIITMLKEEKCEHLVIDLLDRSNEFYNYLNENLKNTCVILDNSEHKEIPASTVVNFSITQNPKFYKNFGSEYFVGPYYVPIEESMTHRKPIWIKNEVERIFVFQGGGDPYGLTSKIIKSLMRLDLKQTIDVIVGGALMSEHIKKLNKIKASLKDKFIFYTNISQEEVYNIMEKVDLAITAAGNTLYELAYFGIPSIVISHHKRHHEVATTFENYNAVINLGIGESIREEDISNQVAKIITDKGRRDCLSENMKKLVDGRGANRVADILIKMLKKERY